LNPWRDLGGLPREVWVLFAATLVNRAGTMALPFLVLYLTRRLGYPAGRAGLILTVYGVSALVVGPIAGRLSDRFGPLRVMKTSLVLSGLVLLAFPLARGAGIAVATALLAVTSESFRPANLSIISSLVAAERRKAAFALNRLAVNIGMSIGPALGGLLATVSFPTLFRVDGATSIAAGIILALSFRRVTTPEETNGAKPGGAKSDETAEPGKATTFLRRQFGVFADRRLVYFLAALLPLLLVLFQNESVMPLFLVRDLGMTEAGYGLMFTINTAIIILLEVPLNTAIAGWPHRRTLVSGALLFAAGFGALALVNSPAGVAATVVVWTFGEMILLPGSSAYVADIAPPERRGEYMGLFTMSFSLAFAVGPWVGTNVYERHGPRAVWLGTLALGLLSAALLWRVKHGTEAAAGG